MSAARWEKVQASFDELVELDPNERASRLASLANTDPELYRTLESLLKADALADAHLAPIEAVLLTGPTRRARLLSALADRYRIEREIGRGGMATVYLARDLKHDRDVALKVLRPELAAVLGVNRFLNEIRISARLDHPHILTLIDSGAADGFLYYVMPFVRGESLRDRLKREKQLGIDEALDITKQITSALDYAHRQGIVHRDIKPENILLHEGEAMLADFGIAMAVKEAGGSRLTESGISLGTPQYMSPEQATGDRPLDARSDVYSIAAVLYEMLAGEPPHSGVSVQAIIAKLLTERPTRLRVIRDTVPEAVDAAVAKALAKLPADRYANAGDFARALTTPGAPRPPLARARRWVPIALGIALTTLLVIAAALILTREPALRSLPDRVQLTVTGNAFHASLSPDGAHLAFFERQCDTVGRCSFQLVIQETDGHHSLVLARGANVVFRTAWTRDGRYVVFDASYGAKLWGTFVVSRLGGPPQRLSAGGFDVPAGDTVVLAVGLLPPDSLGWVRRITAHDGRTIDSIPLHNPGAGWDAGVAVLPYPGKLLVSIRKTWDSAPQLRLIDLNGNVIDTVTPGFGALGRRFVMRWMPSAQRLVVSSQRAGAGTEFDILSMRVTASRIERDIDTVFSGLEMSSDGNFELSPDGERLVHSAGPGEGTLWTIENPRSTQGRFVGKARLPPATTFVNGRISPTGDRILVSRQIPTPGGRTSDLSILPRDGGAEYPILRGVPSLLDFEWARDGAKILYLHGIEGDSVRLMEGDTLGRGTRVIAVRDASAATAFHPLPYGAVCVIPAGRRALSIIRPGVKEDVKLDAPDWIGSIWGVSLSPDTKSLAVLAINRAADAIVVATVDIASGHFAKLGTTGGEWPVRIAWPDDGSIMFVILEGQDQWGFFAATPGKPIQKLGVYPVGDGFSVSKDGKHIVVYEYRIKHDVHMIRNFGKMLRR
jgi:serine/threonine protein kinase/Tol biopolymer transport system component